MSVNYNSLGDRTGWNGKGGSSGVTNLCNMILHPSQHHALIQHPDVQITVLPDSLAGQKAIQTHAVTEAEHDNVTP